MKAAQVIVGFRIDPTADDHLLEDLRSSGAEHLSLRSIIGYVGFCRVADVFGDDSEFSFDEAIDNEYIEENFNEDMEF